MFLFSANLFAAVESVHMESSWGFEKVYSSDDKDFLNKPVEDFPYSLSYTKRDHLLCRTKLTEHLLLEKIEKQQEVATMLRSLKTRDKLSSVDVQKLKRIPDCEPFRFHLHMISKALNGYKLKQIK